MTLPERFWSKVDKTETCWLWTGVKTPDGYGHSYIGGRHEYAHRATFMDARGVVIPKGSHVDHLCRVRDCCNPEHLEIVSPRENVLRSPVAAAALNARKTHCPKGHPYSGDNLRETHDGRKRRCRACRRLLDAGRYRPNKKVLARRAA